MTPTAAAAPGVRPGRTALAGLLMTAPPAALVTVMAVGSSGGVMTGVVVAAGVLALAGGVLLAMETVRGSRTTAATVTGLLLGATATLVALAYEAFILMAIMDEGDGMGAVALVIFAFYAACGLTALAALTLAYAAVLRWRRRPARF